MLTIREHRSKGPTLHHVVLLHAFPVSSKMWDRMIAEYEKLRNDTTFLTLDTPGFGDTPLAEWTMEQFARELATELRVTVTGKLVVAGLSMGGYQALALYRVAPQLCKAIVLSNTKASADSAEAKADRNAFAADVLKRGSIAAIERMLPKFLTGGAPPEMRSEVQSWIEEVDPQAIVNALHAMRDRPDSTPQLSAMHIPSLIIASSNDALMPPDQMITMTKQLPDATFFEIDAAAHLSAVEKPIDWARTLSSFLDAF